MNKSREKEFNNLVEKFKALYNAEVNKDFYYEPWGSRCMSCKTIALRFVAVKWR